MLCESVNPLCRTWNSVGHCLSCYKGYNIMNNACVIMDDFKGSLTVGTNDLPELTDPYCNTYSNKVCVKCALRTYMDPISNRCLQVDSNCKSWTGEGICRECYIGYFIFNQRECKLFHPEVAQVQLKSDLNSDPNCRASDKNGRCNQCIFRYVLENTNFTCLKVDDQCKEWNQYNALCTACYGGFTLK